MSEKRPQFLRGESFINRFDKLFHQNYIIGTGILFLIFILIAQIVTASVLSGKLQVGMDTKGNLVGLNNGQVLSSRDTDVMTSSDGVLISTNSINKTTVATSVHYAKWPIRSDLPETVFWALKSIEITTNCGGLDCTSLASFQVTGYHLERGNGH